jgi:hypothetical protein
MYICISNYFGYSINFCIFVEMKKSKKKLDFNGGWTSGEANRQIGIKHTEKVVESKKKYDRNKNIEKDEYDDWHPHY